MLFGLAYAFCFFFIPLRRLAGGYHANTKLRCFVISNIIYLCNLIFVKEIYLDLFMSTIGSLFVGIAIWILTPVDNANRTLSFADKHRIKNKCGKYILLYESISVALFSLKLESLACMLLGVLVTILALQIVEIIKKVNKISCL